MVIAGIPILQKDPRFRPGKWGWFMDRKSNGWLRVKYDNPVTDKDYSIEEGARYIMMHMPAPASKN
jgi:hypothetical protein